MESGESQLIRWLTETAAVESTSAVRLGIGDDMAILNIGGRDILMSSDMLLDGVHVDTATQPLETIGQKAINSCLSDCAAMAVRPVGVTVSVALPDDWTLEKSQRLFTGMQQAARRFDCAIVGGDTTSCPGRLAIDVCVMAEPYSGCRPIRRSGARVGDQLVVTGRLGGSILGRHLSFTPRIEEAKRVVEILGERVHAMIDISDGLAIDLHRMCEASGVGALLVESQLTGIIHDDAHDLSRRDDKSPLEHALGDGEDYELLIAIDPGVDLTAVADDVPLYAIGQVVDGGLTMLHVNGNETPLPRSGYEHMR